MMGATSFLSETGRGTMRSMVEGHAVSGPPPRFGQE